MKPRRSSGLAICSGIVCLTTAGAAWLLVERLDRSAIGPGAASSWLLEGLLASIAVLAAMLGILFVAHRRRAEAEASEARMRAIVESAPTPIALVDTHGNITLVNARVEGLFGYSRDELLGRSIKSLLPEDGATVLPTPVPGALSILRSAPEDGTAIEIRARRKDGSDVPLEAHIAIVEENGRPLVACVLQDMSDRLRNEVRLREAYRELHFATSRLRGIIEGTTDLVAAVDLQHRFIAVNTSFQREFRGIFGVHVTLGMDLADALVGSPRASRRAKELWDRALGGEEFTVVEQLRQKRGRRRHLEITFSTIKDERGRTIGASQIVRDITRRVETDEQLRRSATELVRSNEELRRLARDLEELSNSREQAYVELQRTYHELKTAESQLVQAEKLSALGRMVAGVAHEINNPLAFVGNNLAVLRRDVGQIERLVRMYQQVHPTLAEYHPDLHERIVELSEQCDLDYTLENLDSITERTSDGLSRIRQIVKDLRDFARLDGNQFEKADLNESLRGTVNIIQGMARDREVTIALDLNPIPQVTCSIGKINQVILNLLVNAVDACHPGGVVSLRTSGRRCVAVHGLPHGPGAQATAEVPGWVTIEVVDDGTGIAPDVRERIFDPFFTTKPAGKGTGLGLSISYGIVQDHGGLIGVESTPGKGSRFVIDLPTSPASSRCTPAPPGEGMRDD